MGLTEGMDNVYEQLGSFDKGAEIAENMARLRWERAKDQALRLHTEAMKNPAYKDTYIQKSTPEVRICNATGHYTPVDLAVLFDIPVSDIKRILRGCG